MYTAALLALAPIAAQAAAQSVRWPVFNLRANVTESYTGYTQQQDGRELWHNAPIGQSAEGDIRGPLFENNDCNSRAGMNDHGPYSAPYIFYPRSTTTGTYAPSEMMAGSDYKMVIAHKNQKDSKGRRAVAMSTCGKGSTSIYVTDTKPHHLTYENKEAKNEKFGSFYLCGNREKGDYFSYGDGLFYRSADETTPEDCGEVIFYPECMPLSYKVTTTQATSTVSIYDGRDQTGHYDAWCYVDVKDVSGGPNSDIMEWYSVPRTRYYPVGKVQV